MKIAAQAALNEGGSSRVALSQLVESWKDKWIYYSTCLEAGIH
jgi:hypothetical protein